MVDSVINRLDKPIVLVPPVSPTETLHTIQNASFFEWLLTKSTENSTLDSTSNVSFSLAIVFEHLFLKPAQMYTYSLLSLFLPTMLCKTWTLPTWTMIHWKVLWRLTLCLVFITLQTWQTSPQLSSQSVAPTLHWPTLILPTTVVSLVSVCNMCVSSIDSASHIPFCNIIVNDAHVVQGNILLNNGVMHLIDSSKFKVPQHQARSNACLMFCSFELPHRWAT